MEEHLGFAKIALIVRLLRAALGPGRPMEDHLRALGIIGLFRALGGVLLGLWLIGAALGLDRQDYGSTRVTDETVTFDRTAFCVIGVAALALAPIRALQAALVLARRPVSRRFGMGLSILDLANLFLFPFSTALGLYGVVVYHHPLTAGLLDSRPDAPRVQTA